MTPPANGATDIMVIRMNEDNFRDYTPPRNEGDLDFEIDFYRGIIDQSPDYVDALAVLGDALTRKGRYAEGLTIDQRLTLLLPNDPIVHYNLACSYNLLHMKKEALQSLRRAIALGYCDLHQIVTDKDLASLHGDRSFHRLIRSLGKKLLRLIRQRQLR